MAENDESEDWFDELPEDGLDEELVEPGVGSSRSSDEDGDPDIPFVLEHEYSLDQLLAMEFVDRPLSLFTRDDVFQEGVSHLLAGAPKVGKSSLMRRASVDWAVEDHKILYFSEEFERVWNKQAIELGFTYGIEGLTVVPALGIPPSTLLKRAIEGPEDIIIVDTVRALLRIQSLINSDETVQKLRPWLQLCQTGKTLIMLHHMLIKSTNKRFGAGVAGGHGLLGAFDAIVQYGEKESDSSRRLVEVRSRLASEHVKFDVVKNGHIWTVEEVSDEITLTDPQLQVWSVLPDDGDGLEISEICEKTKFHESKVRHALGDLTKMGLAKDTTGNASKGGRGMRTKWIAIESEDFQP